MWVETATLLKTWNFDLNFKHFIFLWMLILDKGWEVPNSRTTETARGGETAGGGENCKRKRRQCQGESPGDDDGRCAWDQERGWTEKSEFFFSFDSKINSFMRDLLAGNTLRIIPSLASN